MAGMPMMPPFEYHWSCGGIEVGIDLRVSRYRVRLLLDILPVEPSRALSHNIQCPPRSCLRGVIPVRTGIRVTVAIGWGSLPIFGLLDKSGQTWFTGSPPSVYDLKSDPGQLHNLYSETMADEARELFARFPRNWTPPLPGDLNADTALDSGNQSDERVQDRSWERISPGEMYPLIQNVLNDDPRLSPHHWQTNAWTY